MAQKDTQKKNKTEKKAKPDILPRMTEKAALGADKSGVYVFNVAKDATKKSIVGEVKKLYKVTPVRVRLLAVPTKTRYIRGAWGNKGGGKKAYVYLKKGDKIEM